MGNLEGDWYVDCLLPDRQPSGLEERGGGHEAKPGSNWWQIDEGKNEGLQNLLRVCLAIVWPCPDSGAMGT